jgi:arginine decarboxylase
MIEVPDPPTFSRVHQTLGGEASKATSEGDMRSTFFAAYDATVGEHVPLFGVECDRGLRKGPEMVSTNFVVPIRPVSQSWYPGSDQETINFMRNLDLKEPKATNLLAGLNC